MRESIKIVMIIVIAMNSSTIVFRIQDGLSSSLLDKAYIVILCLFIISLINEIKKLEKEKVTILRINNRSDVE